MEMTPDQFERTLDAVYRDLGGAELYEYVLGDLLGQLQEDSKEFFASQTTPYGTAWTPNAPSTVERKGHGIVLFETGRLKKSLESLSGDSIREFGSRNEESAWATFGTSVPYSIFHSDSTESEADREHVGMTEARLDELSERVLDELVAQFMEGWDG